MDTTDRPPPRAHGGSPLRVSWFELFYDLVIVASFAHTGHLIVSDLSGDRLTMSLGVWLVSTFLITFTLWFATSTAVNIAPGTVTLRKTLMFAQMFSVTIANLALSRSDGLPDDWGFAGLAMAFGTVTAIYAITGQRRPEVKAALAPWIWSSAAAVVVLAVGIVIPDEWINAEIATYGLASALAIVPILLVGVPRLCRMNLVEPEHLAERVGQLVIIVIGESFLGLVLALSGFDYVPGPIFFILTFLVAGSLWAIYFSSVYPMGIPLTPGRLELWLLGVVVLPRRRAAAGVGRRHCPRHGVRASAPSRHRAARHPVDRPGADRFAGQSAPAGSGTRRGRRWARLHRPAATHERPRERYSGVSRRARTRLASSSATEGSGPTMRLNNSSASAGLSASAGPCR